MNSSPLLGSIATICVLANVFVTFPNFCAPVIRILNEAFHSPAAGDVALSPPPCHPFLAHVSLLPPLVASLEADVVPLTETQLFRANLTSQLDGINAKIDALGSIVTALAAASKVKLPQTAVTTLQRPNCSSVESEASSGDSPPGVRRRSTSREGSQKARSEAAHDSLFEAMSTKSLLIRIFLVIGAAILSVSVPNFGFVVGLMGAFTTMLVSFILPTVFYVIVHWHSISRVNLMLCGCVIILGFGGMVVGLENTLSGNN